MAAEPRDAVRLCTKVFFPTGPGTEDRGLSRRHIVAACDASLRRLGTDYIDLYQAHRYDPQVPLEETIRAFAEMVGAGKVRYVGVWEWTADQLGDAMRLAREVDLPLVANQTQYSLLWRVPEAEVRPLAAEEGIGLVAYSPLAQGVLTGEYRPGVAAPGGSRAACSKLDASIFRYLADPVLAAVARVREAVAEAGLPLAGFALAWLLNRPTVATAIIGASRPDQVRANARALDVPLPDELVARVDAILGDLVERDPTKTGRGFDLLPRWRRSW